MAAFEVWALTMIWLEYFKLAKTTNKCPDRHLEEEMWAQYVRHGKPGAEEANTKTKRQLYNKMKHLYQMHKNDEIPEEWYPEVQQVDTDSARANNERGHRAGMFSS